MNRFALVATAAIGLAPLLGLAGAAGKDPPKPQEGATCSQHGTTIDFYDTPSAAAKKAKDDQKLVLILHVSGHFEDPRFTWNNAEALRVNALANPEVGKYVNEYFCASFQKVATFTIANGQKQGGNVATYFCAPDGRVLHVVAGPVDANTMLQEAKWVVETVKKAVADSKGDGGKFKAMMRKEHAEKIRRETGLVVEAVTFDPPDPDDDNSALSYRDPSGRPLAPKLPPPPIDGPDVTFKAKQDAMRGAPAAAEVADRKGRRWVLGNQGRSDMLMAAYSMMPIDKVYGTVFENILGEKVSTKPVEVKKPFSWIDTADKKQR